MRGRTVIERRSTQSRTVGQRVGRGIAGVLLIAVAALWLRSEYITDVLRLHVAGGHYALMADQGRLAFEWAVFREPMVVTVGSPLTGMERLHWSTDVAAEGGVSRYLRSPRGDWQRALGWVGAGWRDRHQTYAVSGPGFNHHVRQLIVPLWLFAVLAAVPWLVDGWRGCRAWRRRRGGRCPGCGYDRRGTSDGAACPECGA